MPERDTPRQILEFTKPIEVEKLAEYIGFHTFVAYKHVEEIGTQLTVVTGLLSAIDDLRLQLDWGPEISIVEITFIAVAILNDE